MKYSGLFLVACVALFTSTDAATLIRSNSGTPIPGSYIVVLKEGKNLDDFVPKFEDIAKRQNGRGRKPTISRQYKSMGGFSATVNDAALKELLASDDVDFIEEDQIYTINVLKQNNPPSWGLPRVSQKKRKLGAPYLYQNQAGSGVTAYVIDTGINAGHSDFGGRASMGANLISGSINTDENGHGTHVAGTIGGTKYGVAKKVKLVGIKVLSAKGSGPISGIIAGMDWVAQRAKGTKAVVNMSLGGGKSASIDQAVGRLYKAGIPVFVAAGNDKNFDACKGSPSGAGNAFTVAASDINDRIASFSSWGKCVDIFAPGVDITSAWIGSKTAINRISGTSMATPHVAGVAALLLSSDPKLKTPQDVYKKLISSSTRNVVTGTLKGSVNRMVFNGAA